MKKRWMYWYLGVAATAFSLTVPVAAEEMEETAVESESDAEAQEDVVLEADGLEIMLVNEAGRKIESAEADEQSAEEGKCTVILTAEDGQHIFEEVNPQEWIEPKLTDDQGFLYIQYTDADGNSREAAETGESKAPEGDLTVWALTDVNMRAESSSSSEVVAVVGLGDECKVLALLPGWYQVEYNGEEGYINHRFLSDDQADAEAAAQQEQAAADAAAAAAQQSAYSYSYSKSGSGKKSNKSNNTGKKQEECLNNGLLN